MLRVDRVMRKTRKDALVNLYRFDRAKNVLALIRKARTWVRQQVSVEVMSIAVELYPKTPTGLTSLVVMSLKLK